MATLLAKGLDLGHENLTSSGPLIDIRSDGQGIKEQWSLLFHFSGHFPSTTYFSLTPHHTPLQCTITLPEHLLHSTVAPSHHHHSAGAPPSLHTPLRKFFVVTGFYKYFIFLCLSIFLFSFFVGLYILYCSCAP
ncbi:hypothetical protein HanIR_Chr15g0762541 [Helianthus annuus]|nr:hypothetical protein HanIR_Chr15g0762541 [Helianthus annuus]